MAYGGLAATQVGGLVVLVSTWRKAVKRRAQRVGGGLLIRLPRAIVPRRSFDRATIRWFTKKPLLIVLKGKQSMTTAVSYRSVQVDGVNVFYREAGPADGPVVLLLHGFPSAGHMFRDLIPLLSEKYRVVAPDLPGFGKSDMPSRDKFEYTFENIANIIDGFVGVIGLERFAIYVFDYGAPTGFRLAMRRPERVTALISQNGNAYEEGLSDGWAPIRMYWEDRSSKNREALRSFMAPETTVWQYTHGVADPTAVSPDGYSLDNFYLSRQGADEVQLDLLGDYRSNVELYPSFQEYFRNYAPPTLAVWGRNDPFFLPAGAEAFKRDIPHAEVVFFDTGHFALETHAAEIGSVLHKFLADVDFASA